MSPRRGAVRGSGDRRGGARSGTNRGRTGRQHKQSAGLTRRAFLGAGLGAAGVLAAGGMAGTTFGFGRLNSIARHDPDRLAELRADSIPLLFERFPRLIDHVPWLPLSTGPTPVEQLPDVAGASDISIFIKRDDTSSSICGGGAVRKLEFLLADAGAAGSRTVVGAGGTGTEFGLAAALHARRIGASVRLALFDQPVTPEVRRNLLGLAASDAQLHYSRGIIRSLRDARGMHQESDASYFIVPGGSTRLGTFGLVNAAFELAHQIRSGAGPEPDRIFVAAATCGTAAGLIAGCRLAGLRSRVTAVRVAPLLPAHAVTIRAMARDIIWFMHDVDHDVPRLGMGFDDFDLVTDQIGAGYGHPTEAGTAARAWAAHVPALEATCTAKALAACLHYCRTRARPGETVLFWNTANGASVPLAQPDSLPPALRAVLNRAS